MARGGQPSSGMMFKGHAMKATPMSVFAISITCPFCKYVAFVATRLWPGEGSHLLVSVSVYPSWI